MKAIIIKGNPKYIKDNPKADAFYHALKLLLEENGYSVGFDAGDPYTQPDSAHVWIGHSRGADRLRFAPEGVKVIAIGSYREGAINHADDTSAKTCGGGIEPNEYHYVLTEEMKERIILLLQSQ